MWASRSMRNAAQSAPLPPALPLLRWRLKVAPSSSAEVAEWQTQRTQNPPWATTCGFKSRSRHQYSHRQWRFLHDLLARDSWQACEDAGGKIGGVGGGLCFFCDVAARSKIRQWQARIDLAALVEEF